MSPAPFRGIHGASPSPRDWGEGVDPMAEPEETCCPFLFPVVADRLWMYPTAAYCHRPGARVRVPAARTVEDVCDTADHSDCPGYQTAYAEEPPRASG